MSENPLRAGQHRTVIDFGHQPLSDAFLTADQVAEEFTYRLELVVQPDVPLVHLAREVPRDLMFHQAYPYRSSLSSRMREHFTAIARRLVDTELTGPDPFIVEIGCNDGVMLQTVAAAGLRHLGVEPSGGVADLARAKGVRVRTAFFEKATAAEVLAADGPADVVYAANTLCHIPYLESIFEGLDTLLTERGVLVFEDPYLGDIVEQTSYDQIYDEHYYFFSATSVAAVVADFGFELVDVERLAVHGGELRYTVARRGARPVQPSVPALIAEEAARGLHDVATLDAFAQRVRRGSDELVALLRRLAAEGKRVVGYGATAKSATVTNFGGIGPDLVPVVYDTTPEKQGKLTPGAHIPVVPASGFATDRPDYAVLFAWNHAEEIIANETAFRDAGGKWILYVPDVHIVDPAAPSSCDRS